MQIIASSFGTGITADTQGNLYWTDYINWPSGGALAPGSGFGVMKLSPDGSRLLYSSSLPSMFAKVAARTAGSVWVAGWTNVPDLPVTPGAVQPRRDPAGPGTDRNPQNLDDGFAARLDLSSFADGNFFVSPVSQSITWRLGQPLPPPVLIPIQFSGNAAPLEVSASSSMLTAMFSPTPSPAVAI
jgi:hypothetical protein